MSRFGAPFYNIGNGALIGKSVITLHVETTGDDDTGDGYISRPFATIQRALDEIPFGFDGSVDIRVGAGTFGMPLNNRVLGPNALVVVSGSLSSEYLDVSSVTSEDFSLVSGTVATEEATVPAHSGLDPMQHFAGKDFGPYAFGYTIYTTGAGTTLRCHSNRKRVFDQVVKIYNYTTIINWDGFGLTGNVNSENLSQIYFTGIKMVGSNKTVKNCYIYGNAIDNEGGTIYFGNCIVSSTISGSVDLYNATSSGTCSLEDSEVSGYIAVDSDSYISGKISGEIVAVSSLRESVLRIALVDFQNGGSVRIQRGTDLRISGNISTDSSNTALITAKTGSTVFNDNSTLVPVSLNGPLLQLEDGAEAYGMSTLLAGSSNAATPGEDVIVGGSGGHAISDLPVVNLADGTRAS